MEFLKGDVVRHPIKSDWGPGRVIDVAEKHWIIYFLDGGTDNPKKIVKTFPLQIANAGEDVRFDRLPSDVELLNGPPQSYVAFEDAVQRFEKAFPLWFEDPAYIRGEREQKWNAHEVAEQTLDEDAIRNLLKSEDYGEIVRRALEVFTSVLLLSKFEHLALHEALKTRESQQTFSVALGELLHGKSPAQARFEQFGRAVASLPTGKAKLSHWPVQTLLPFVMFPEREMFLKPRVTQRAAKRLGFKLDYRNETNWLTYSRLLTLGKVLRKKLTQYGPRDLIDVQSFIWYVGDATPLDCDGPAAAA